MQVAATGAVEPQSFDRVLSSMCTRPHPAARAAALDALWPDGYREGFERAQANADWLAAALADRGVDMVELVLPLVAADVPERAFDALRAEGWRLSRTGVSELRVVCMPHVTREMLESFGAVR